MKKILLVSFATLASLAPSTAQDVVDYPNSTLVDPPELLFPFYTGGGGGFVRYQTWCPSSFAHLPSQSRILTGIGMQIAGQALYDQFEIRVGATTQASLSACFAANLPDGSPIQRDLSGTVLQGGLQGGQPINQWVEFDLDRPFVWNPGEGIVLDVTSSAAVPGSWCHTGTGTGERVFAHPYDGSQTCGSFIPTSGLKFRMLFEPVGFPTYGQSCAGEGGFQPAILGSGSTQPGSLAMVDMENGLGGAPTTLSIGFSRQVASFGALPFALGSGCELLNEPTVTFAVGTIGTGAGNGTAQFPLIVPTDPTLSGFVAYAQWLQIDAASGAIVPVVASNGLILVLD